MILGSTVSNCRFVVNLWCEHPARWQMWSVISCSYFITHNKLPPTTCIGQCYSSSATGLADPGPVQPTGLPRTTVKNVALQPNQAQRSERWKRKTDAGKTAEGKLGLSNNRGCGGKKRMWGSNVPVRTGQGKKRKRLCNRSFYLILKLKDYDWRCGCVIH